MVVTNAELEQMRRTVRSLMPDTITPQRPTTAPDGLGGITRTWTPLTPVRGLVGAPGSSETPSDRGGPRIGEREIRFPALTDVRVGDRLVTPAGTFRIKRLGSPKSFEVARVVVVEDDKEA